MIFWRIARLFAGVAMLGSLTLVLSGCANLNFHNCEGLQPQTFRYKDGGSSQYYRFAVGDAQKARIAVFFYGGLGYFCSGWGHVMPGYVEGLGVDAQVFALNKRFVIDPSPCARYSESFRCGEDFTRANLPAQWAADYGEFIQAQLGAAAQPFKNVVLVGVSEGAWPAAAIAARLPVVTHLAIINAGGYTMRENLATLKRKGAFTLHEHIIVPDVDTYWKLFEGVIAPDVDADWKQIKGASALDVDAGWKQITSDPQSLEKTWYYDQPYRWWSAVMDLDPMDDLSRLDIPVLVGVGERDKDIPVESARYLATRFQQLGKHNLSLKIYPGAAGVWLQSGSHHSYLPEFFAALGCMLQPAGGGACAAASPSSQPLQGKSP